MIPLPFTDRTEAGAALAEALQTYAGPDTLVLAIPRGGVPLGRIVADRLGADLDVVLVRKLGAPGNPEYAVGAVDEEGHVHRTPEAWGIVRDPAVLQSGTAAGSKPSPSSSIWMQTRSADTSHET